MNCNTIIVTSVHLISVANSTCKVLLQFFVIRNINCSTTLKLVVVFKLSIAGLHALCETNGKRCCHWYMVVTMTQWTVYTQKRKQSYKPMMSGDGKSEHERNVPDVSAELSLPDDECEFTPFVTPLVFTGTSRCGLCCFIARVIGESTPQSTIS